MLDVALATVSVDSILESFLADVESAIPRLISGLIFLVVAFVGIKLVTTILRAALGRVYSGDQQLVADLFVLVVSIFLWFGAGLTLLSILGMGQIAASLGTAAGFIALGISYALSNMIADTVAGVYLLRDPDFNPGDEVKSDPVTGVVTAIELRKTRFRDEEGRTVVVANRDVEKKWTQLDAGHDADTSD